MTIRSEFAVHMLNDAGKEKARDLAQSFSDLLDRVEHISGKDGREIAIVRTHLEQAGFFAKKAMAVRAENQQ